MDSPDGHGRDVAVLRNTNASLRKFGLVMAGLLLPGTVAVATGGWSPGEALAVTVVPMVVAAPYMLRRFFWKYTVRGTVLEIRTLFRRLTIDLPAVDAAALMVTGHDDRARRLMLILRGHRDKAGRSQLGLVLRA